MVSTSELMARETAAEEAFQASGQAQKYKDAVKERIALVVASGDSQPKRRFRNLWGLNPVKSQELLYYKAGDFGINDLRVGGKRIDTDLSVAEDLVTQVVDELTKGREVDYSEPVEGTIKSLNTFTTVTKVPSLGIELHRTDFFFKPWIRKPDGSVAVEFIPGYNPHIATHLDVVLASEK
jgi:hypothetical protein